jgi:hypothetical protein
LGYQTHATFDALWLVVDGIAVLRSRRVENLAMEWEFGGLDVSGNEEDEPVDLLGIV